MRRFECRFVKQLHEMVIEGLATNSCRLRFSSVESESARTISVIGVSNATGVFLYKDV